MHTHPISKLSKALRGCLNLIQHKIRFSFRALELVALVFGTLGLIVSSAVAQSSGKGEITGRVLNTGTNEYLRNAAITVVGTSLSVISEEGGEYRFVGVPAGEARVTVTYAGLDDLESTVTVVAGQTAKHDFNLTSKDYAIKLREFVVSSGREGNAKAIMEQKEAINMKSVIASDAFGDVSEGNVGEFLKLLPGVIMDYNEADIKYVRVRGMDPKYTSVLMDGAPVATGSSSDITQNRAFDFEQISISSIETVELSKTPRPSDAGSALAGVVNLRSKGAFNYKGRRITFQADTSINSLDLLKKTAGPMDGESYKILPNAALSYADVYFGGKLGVIVGYNYAYTFSEQKAETITIANRDTNPFNNATEVPRISSIAYRDSPKPTTRADINARVDYKFDVSNGELWSSARVDYNIYHGRFFSRDLGFSFTTPDNTQPVSLTTETTTVGGGTVAPNGGGGAADKHGTTLTFNTNTTYKIGALSAYFVGQYSKATNYYTDLDEGFFSSVGGNSLPITMRFDRGSPNDPGVYITQLAGPDWRNLSNYTLATGLFTKRATRTQEYTGKTDLTYNIVNGPLPTQVNFGGQVTESIRRVNRYSNSGGTQAYTYLGPDGIRNTADDSPALFAEPHYRMNFGWGGNVDGMTNVDRFALGKALHDNPQYFLAPNPTATLQTTFQNAYYFAEQIDAAYLEPVVKIGKKLRIAPGTRYEYTRDAGAGPVDIGDAAAKRILTGSSTGTVDTSSAAYTITRYGSGRRNGGKNYGTWLKYLHLTYAITPDLNFRASYNDSITRSDIANLIPGISGINESATPLPTITISNPNLKPEHARNVNLELEYYFAKGSGIVDVTIFRTDVKNLQRRIVEELGPDGFQGDTTYAGFAATTFENVAKVHNSGVEFDYHERLTFLPAYLRTITVFANLTLLKPDNSDNYLNSANHAANGGIEYQRGRFDARVNVNWTGVVKNSAPLAGATNAGWDGYTADRLRVDVNFGYRIISSISLFATARNVFNEPTVTFVRGGPGQPVINTRWLNSGSLLSMGIKGTY